MAVENILKIYRLATPEEVDFWAHWYNNAHDMTKELAQRYNEDFNKTAAIVAVMSPGALWKLNLYVAGNIIERLQKFEAEPQNAPVVDGFLNFNDWRQFRNFALIKLSKVGGEENALPGYNDNKAKACDIYFNERYNSMIDGKSPKVVPFFNSIRVPTQVLVNQYHKDVVDGAGFSDVTQISADGITLGAKKIGVKYTKEEFDLVQKVVADGHAINIARGTRVKIKGTKIHDIENFLIRLAYVRAANQVGLTATQMQAVTWYLWKSIAMDDK